MESIEERINSERDTPINIDRLKRLFKDIIGNDYSIFFLWALLLDLVEDKMKEVSDKDFRRVNGEKKSDAYYSELLIIKQDIENWETADENELAQARKRIAELEKQLSGVERPTTGGTSSRTQLATQAKAEKTANEWEGYLQCAVLMAIYVYKNPPSDAKGYNRTDLNDILMKHGWSMNKRALDAFRKAMPSDLINKSGGAPSQS
jgi:hypothetical protein